MKSYEYMRIRIGWRFGSCLEANVRPGAMDLFSSFSVISHAWLSGPSIPRMSSDDLFCATVVLTMIDTFVPLASSIIAVMVFHMIRKILLVNPTISIYGRSQLGEIGEVDSDWRP